MAKLGRPGTGEWAKCPGLYGRRTGRPGAVAPGGFRGTLGDTGMPACAPVGPRRPRAVHLTLVPRHRGSASPPVRKVDPAPAGIRETPGRTPSRPRVRPGDRLGPVCQPRGRGRRLLPVARATPPRAQEL